jgi:FtsZ-binding cell division protein ZapB
MKSFYDSYDFMTVVSMIKEKYSNGFTQYEAEEIYNDCIALINGIGSNNEVKDPRVTIELAKLRKENNSLKKELSKFFPAKDSIERASKKLENLFQVDSISLLRYENSELKEKNEKMTKEIIDLKQKAAEIEKNIQLDQSNFEKIKAASSSLRIENTNLILQNRDLLKRNKILEDQTQITESLHKKLRTALLDTDKGRNFKETIENYSQTDVPAPSTSKVIARLASKTTPKLEVYSYHIKCPSIPQKNHSRTIFSLEVFPIKNKIFKTQEENKKKQEKKLELVDNTKTSKLPISKPKLFSFGITKPLSISVMPSISNAKPDLKVSKPINISLIKAKSFNPKPMPGPKPKLSVYKQLSVSYSPKPHFFSLSFQPIFNRNEVIEEFEVFNALTVYKPELSMSKSIHQAILPGIKQLSIVRTPPITYKTSKIELKVANFIIFNAKPPVFALSVFNSISKHAKLDIVVLRKYNFIPEIRNTDDEETKSNSGNSRRKARTPVRKPAIEEYFNLVSLT